MSFPLKSSIEVKRVLGSSKQLGDDPYRVMLPDGFYWWYEFIGSRKIKGKTIDKFKVWRQATIKNIKPMT